MTAELQDLLDKEAIREAMLRYCRGVDRADPELVASAYHPDAVDEHGSARFAGDAIGAGIVALVERNHVSLHQMTNQLIALHGDGRASSETYFTAWQGSATEGRERMLMALGRYLDRFEKREGAWKISHRQVVVEHVRVLGDEGVVAQPSPPMGSRDRLDPSYRLLDQV